MQVKLNCRVYDNRQGKCGGGLVATGMDAISDVPGPGRVNVRALNGLWEEQRSRSSASRWAT